MDERGQDKVFRLSELVTDEQVSLAIEGWCLEREQNHADPRVRMLAPVVKNLMYRFYLPGLDIRSLEIAGKPWLERGTQEHEDYIQIVKGLDGYQKGWACRAAQAISIDLGNETLESRREKTRSEIRARSVPGDPQLTERMGNWRGGIDPQVFLRDGSHRDGLGDISNQRGDNQ